MGESRVPVLDCTGAEPPGASGGEPRDGHAPRLPPRDELQLRRASHHHALSNRDCFFCPCARGNRFQDTFLRIFLWSAMSYELRVFLCRRATHDLWRMITSGTLRAHPANL